MAPIRAQAWVFACIVAAGAGCESEGDLFEGVVGRLDGGTDRGEDGSPDATDTISPISGEIDGGGGPGSPIPCGPCLFPWDCAALGSGATCSGLLDGPRCTAPCDFARQPACSEGFTCILGQCMPAGGRCNGCATTGCRAEERCNRFTGLCEARLGRCSACELEGDCVDELVCARTPLGGLCADGCKGNDGCPQGQVCANGACLLPTGMCSPCGGCPPARPACNALTGSCTECAPAWPCDGGQVCNPLGQCVAPAPPIECLSDFDCRLPDRSHCVFGRCVQCRDELDCGVGEVCRSGNECEAQACAGVTCQAGTACNPETERCVTPDGEPGCTQDADCGGPLLRCNSVTGQCYRRDQRCDLDASEAVCAPSGFCNINPLVPSEALCSCARTNPADPLEPNGRHRIPCQPGGYCLHIGDGPGVCIGEPDSPEDPGPGIPPPPAQICGACLTWLDCIDLGVGTTCSALLGGSFCTSPCDASAQPSCDAGFVCVLGQCYPAGARCDGCALEGCGRGERCNPISGFCEPQLGQCESCERDSDCAGGRACVGTPLGRVCADRCEEDPCNDGLACVEGACLMPSGICDPCGGCPPESPACNPVTRACTVCGPGWSCPPARLCGPRGECVEIVPGVDCFSAVDCRAADAPHCVAGRCVGCRSGLDCAARQACVDGQCVAAPCAGLRCSGDAACDEALGQCVDADARPACVGNQDCQIDDDTPRLCNVETGQCYRFDQRCDIDGGAGVCGPGSECRLDPFSPFQTVCMCARTEPGDWSEPNEAHRIPCHPGGFCLQLGAEPGVCVVSPDAEPPPVPIREVEVCEACEGADDCRGLGEGAACSLLVGGAFCTVPCDPVRPDRCDVGYQCVLGQCVPAGSRCDSCATARCGIEARCDLQSGLCEPRRGRCGACDRDETCGPDLVCTAVGDARICADRCNEQGDAPCPGLLVCVNGACLLPSGQCDPCAGCAGETPACNPTTGLCTACGPEWPCAAGQVCNPAGQCIEGPEGVQCVADPDCARPDAEPSFCVQGNCVSCRDRLDCNPSEACEEGECVVRTCAGMACQAGSACRPELGVDVCSTDDERAACREDADCADGAAPERVCNPPTGQCYQADQRCDLDGARTVCAPGSECQPDPMDPARALCVCARRDAADADEPNDQHRIPCQPGGICLQIGMELGMCVPAVAP